eukprot:4410554-Prymnesium_polylepis.1
MLLGARHPKLPGDPPAVVHRVATARTVRENDVSGGATHGPREGLDLVDIAGAAHHATAARYANTQLTHPLVGCCSPWRECERARFWAHSALIKSTSYSSARSATRDS